jgi:ABC-type amino acid transport substrate-binding protein
MRLRIATLLGFIYLSNIGFAQIVDVQLASDVWPPFTSQDEKQALASQIVKEALNRNEVAMSTKTVDFNYVIQGLKDNNYDGSAALWKNEDRTEFLIFSKPYLTNQLVLVGRKGSVVDYIDLAELKGSKLGLVTGYSYGIPASDLSEIEVVYGKSDQINITALLKNQVDYVLVDQILIEYLMQFQPVEMNQHLDVASTPMIARSLHFALRKNLEGSDALIEKFNSTIDVMMADGTYNRILRLNWIKTDIDGDGVLELVSLEGGSISPNGGYNMTGQNDAMLDGEGQKYYIAGTLYNSWSEVPEGYKGTVLTEEDVEEFSFMRINF